MRTIATLSLLSLTVVALAQTTTMESDVTYGGKLVGSNSLTMSADGSYESQTKFDIGPQHVNSHLSVQMVNGKMAKMTLHDNDGKVEMHLVWSDNKASLTAAGKSVFKDKAAKLDAPMFMPFHPVTLAAVYKEYVAQKNPPKIKVFYFNPLTSTSFEATATPMTAELKTGHLPITHFKLKAGGMDLIFAIDDQNRVLGFNVPVQTFQFVAKGYEGIFVDPLSKYPELSQPTFKTKTETRVKMKTRDGVTLYSDIVRPDDTLKHPTVLIRTPYGRLGSAIGYEYFARRGYVVVAQDVRGRGASDGEWDPLNHEVADGDDTLTWIAQQSWSDGSAGMIGGSYLGFVQWAAAVTHNPVLKCIIPQVSPPDPVHNLPWDNGTLMMASGLWWARIVMEHQANMAAAAQGISDYKPFLSLPVSTVDNRMFGKNVPFFDLWVKRPTLKDWPGSFTEDQVKDVKIPVMHISGVWDGDGIGTRMHWEELRENGGNQWLVFGPWEHGFNIKTRFGDQDYGPGSVLELDSSYLRFFDTFLKGKDVGLDKQPRVRFFVTGANKWDETSNWPPEGAQEHTWYLGGGAANGAKSKGTLTGAPGSGKDSIDYDPAKVQVPKGSADVDSGRSVTIIKPGTLTAADLIYRSEPFKIATSITALDADLYVSTTVKGADFHVNVFDEAPDGKLMLVDQAGHGSMSFLGNDGKPVTPGKVYKITIKPWYFARQFAPGHRLTIHVRSDMFPGFARNPGTGQPLSEATHYLRAVNTVHKSKEYPSAVRFYTFPF